MRVEHLPERSAVRVVVTGAVGLSSGAVPGRQPATASEADATAQARGYERAEAVGQYWLARIDGRRRRVARSRSLRRCRGRGRWRCPAPPEYGSGCRGSDDRDRLQENVKRVGPVSISPDAWVICGSRFLQVPQPDSSNVFETVRAVSAGPIDQTVVIIGRE